MEIRPVRCTVMSNALRGTFGLDPPGECIDAGNAANLESLFFGPSFEIIMSISGACLWGWVRAGIDDRGLFKPRQNGV